MVVAVAVVGVVQMTVDQVVDVVTVRDGFVPAAFTVPVARRVGPAGVVGRAVGRVAAADAQAVLVHVVRVRMVEVPVVQVVDVAVVPKGEVAAAISVDVGVAVVAIAGHLTFPRVT